MTLVKPLARSLVKPLPRSLIEGVGYPKLTAAIAAWLVSQAAVRVTYGGNTALQDGTDYLSGSNATGRTFLLPAASPSMLQDGYIRRIVAIISTSTADPSNTFRFKVFRPNGSNYDFVSESELLSVATGGAYSQVTIDLGQPMACQPGDRLGIWVKGLGGNACLIAISATGSWAYVAGDRSAGITSGELTSGATGAMCIVAYGTPPILVGAGDSIMEGHNGASNWHSLYHTGPAGTPGAEPLNQMRALLPTLEYQNYGQGSQTWAFAASTAGADIAAKTPWGVVAHYGVNDVSAGRTWAAIEANMDAFLAALPVGTKVFINEVLPWNDASDAQAAAVRDLNANYATWCSANGATLISCHNPMGQIRGSTGELDDLITAYAYGTVHLSVPTGVDAFARQMVRGIEASL